VTAAHKIGSHNNCIVIPEREHSERIWNLEIPGSMLRIAPE